MCKHLLKIQRLILALLIFGGGIFYTSSATARVCFLPDSTDCGEGDVDVPDVQVTCATYGGYETPEACLAALKDEPAKTCILNSGCYYPKCAYDSERNCKRENPNKNCLSKDVEGVKCWYSQAKTCSEQGYKNTPCTTDEDSGTVPNTLEASDGPCYKCTPKKECKYISNLYYGPNDTCPQYTDRKDAGVTGKDGVCSTCEPQACTKINTAYKNAANQNTCGSGKKSQKVDGTDSAADGPCYTCVDKGDGSYDYIIYIDDTQSQENDKVTISRSVYSTDRNATFDAESVADVTEERCDWNCNCDEGGTSISLANGKTATYWDVNEEAGGGSSGGCDYTRTYVSWNYTKVTVNGTTKEYKNTQCKDGTITDSKGTVYKIVCGIPTCSDIGYQTTPCSTGYKQIDYIQLPHEDCYKCEDKPTCKYKHVKVTTSDINGSLTFDPNSKSGYDLNDKIQRRIIESVSYYKDAKNKNYHLYNTISKDSKTCYDEKGTLRYETICTDHNKKYCDTQRGKKFTRTCTSEEYNIGLKVESMEFGTCECDLDRRFYKTEDACLKANESQSLKCTKRDSECYRTCEDEGMYSTEDACKTDTKGYSVKCTEVGNCYKQEMDGFLIKIYEHTIRSFDCRHADNPGYSQNTHAYLSDIRDDDFPGGLAKTVNGEFGRYFDDSFQQFPAGTYYLCYRLSVSSQYGFPTPAPSVKAVYVDRYPAVVDTIIDVDKTPLRDGCAKVKFEAGTTYSVQFSYTGPSEADVTCTGH